MLFNEIFSTYYLAAAKLIEKAINESLDEKTSIQIIRDVAFSDSFVYILENIKTENWQIITKDFKTPIENAPKTPLTLLEKQFIKAISQDPRFKLFYDEELFVKDNIEPLYRQEDFEFFDKMKDGDPFENKEYIKIFKTAFRAIKEKRLLKIVFRDGKGRIQSGIYTPRKLEYSQKDDKFRLICRGGYGYSTINISRIKSCELRNFYDAQKTLSLKRKMKSVTLQITDKRNALERCMLHFANFRKTTRQTGEKLYEMELEYYRDDETEVLIRILSFGPMVKVIEPKEFVDLIIERLEKQRNLTNQL